MIDAIDRLRVETPRIVECFGDKSQILKAIEELSELTIELSRGLAVSDRYKLEYTQEEIADCLLMLFQLRIIFGIDEVDDFIRKKLDRVRRLSSVQVGIAGEALKPGSAVYRGLDEKFYAMDAEKKDG